MLKNKVSVSLGFIGVWCIAAALCLCGCSTPDPKASAATPAAASAAATTDNASKPGAAATDVTMTEPVSADLLRPNDLVTVVFAGIPSPPDAHTERINENGQITLQLLGQIQAAGKTPAQLQDEIQHGFVPKYFQRLVVTVQTENRFFFVRGEVKNPSRLVYAGGITVLKAIAAAGDFTDFAKRGSVELRRIDGRRFIINTNKARRNQALDLPVIPGDEIFVPRRIW